MYTGTYQVRFSHTSQLSKQYKQVNINFRIQRLDGAASETDTVT